MQHSDFPINLSSAHLKELNEVFDSPAATINTTTTVAYDAVRPFKTRGSRPFDVEHGSEKELVSFTAVPAHGDTTSVDTSNVFGRENPNVVKLNLLDLRPRLPSSCPIPDAFGPGVFDHAEEGIKYMVLTNTWPRFIDAGYANSLKPKRTSTFAWLGDILCAPQRASFRR